MINHIIYDILKKEIKELKSEIINLQKKLENKKNELVSFIIQAESDSSDNEVQISNLISSLFYLFLFLILGQP